MMRKYLFTLLILLTTPLFAADYEAGIRHLSLSPMASGDFAGGDVDVVSSRGFGATLEVFWTERVSTEAAATFFNPAAFLYPATPPPGDVDLGTLGIDIYSLSGRYHFRPHARFSPFAGAGAARVTFGDLEDRFGNDVEMRFGAATTLFAEGGVRYRLRPNVFLDATVSYMPLDATVTSVRNDDPRITLPSRLPLDPATISVGAAWRF